MSKIKAITIVTKQGMRTYEVGNEINGLTIDRIRDRSVEFPDSLYIIYEGWTAQDDLVFEAINLPIDVEYMKEDKNEKELL